MPFSNHSKKIDSRHKRKAIAGNLFSEKNQKSPKNFSVVSEKTFLLLLKSTFFESNRDVGHQKEKKIEMPSSIITGLKCVNKNLLELIIWSSCQMIQIFLFSRKFWKLLTLSRDLLEVNIFEKTQIGKSTAPTKHKNRTCCPSTMRSLLYCSAATDIPSTITLSNKCRPILVQGLQHGFWHY